MLLDRGADIDAVANVRAKCDILWVWAIVTVIWSCGIVVRLVSDISLWLCCSLSECIMQYGKTALHAATDYDKRDVATLLMDRGANIGAVANVRAECDRVWV